jgi:urease accessory protein
MLRPTLSQRASPDMVPQARLVLPFDSRQKSRLLAALDNGIEVGVLLPRGTVLRGGDLLETTDGFTVEVVAAAEPVSIVTSHDPRMLARAAYHLGNRHVPVQIMEAGLRYLHDHVLDDMLRGLGFEVRHATLPFEPEGGAYSQGAAASHVHAHGHDHSHDEHATHN